MKTQYVIERQALSQDLTDLWQRVLGKEVTPEDDFFALGGNSLTAIRMITEVQSLYNAEIDVETFFEEPCIANLVDTILKTSTTAP